MPKYGSPCDPIIGRDQNGNLIDENGDPLVKFIGDDGRTYYKTQDATCIC